VQIFRDSTRNSEASTTSIQALTAKETTSKAHMQMHTNGESREKLQDKSRAEMGPAGRPNPFRARFDTLFDLDVVRTIYSPLAKSHGGIHSSSAAEE
jgi:hypothetical protein